MEPDAAATEDRHRLPGLEPRGPECGADPGEDAAAHQRRAVERQVGVDLHDRVLVEQHPLRVAAHPGERPQALAALRKARRGGGAAGHRAADTQVGMAGEALRAAAAEAGEACDDMIASLHGGHVRSHRLDDPRALVAEHDRPAHVVARGAVDHVQIAVAHARRHRADEHLAARRLIDLDRLDRHRLVDPVKHRGADLHAALPATSVRTANSAMAGPHCQRRACGRVPWTKVQ